MKVLFLVPYPTEGASNRIRVEQLIPYLESRGISCKVRPFVNPRFYKIIYMPHRYAEKTFWFIVCTLNRLFDIARALTYDIVFIHRESYPFGGPIIESILHRMGKRLVFDFDDAIFLPNTSEQNIYIERFKDPDKVGRIIKMSAMVIAGNDYLKAYALKHNSDVKVIPSSVDTSKYRPRQDSLNEKDYTVIGWVGSNTTKRFLYDLEGVFVALSHRHKDLVFHIVGAPFYSRRLKNAINKEWSLEGEAAALRDFDIGIMPMPDNEWTRGKCGFKALLYMACAVPVVASPVGMNLEIIEDGVDGFFARNDEEWFDKLSVLIEDERLRKEMGRHGREKVLERYALSQAAPVFYEVLMSAKRSGKNEE